MIARDDNTLLYVIDAEIAKKLNPVETQLESEITTLNTTVSGISTTVSGISSAIADSGWTTVTLTEDFEPYATGVLPKYRKIGSVVNLHGVLKPTDTLTGSNTTVAMFSLPTGYRPSENIITVCQGSGNCIWTLTVASGGTCSFSRYRDGTGLQNASSSVWLPFNVTFMIG